MLLSFHIADIIQVPFGYLMELLYRLTNSYGMALILFAILVQLVLLPITAKSKKSMMKMSRLTPRMRPSKSCTRKRACPWAAAACGALCPCCC